MVLKLAEMASVSQYLASIRMNFPTTHTLNVAGRSSSQFRVPRAKSRVAIFGQGDPAQAFGNPLFFAGLRSLLLPWVRRGRPGVAGTAAFAADLQVVGLKVRLSMWSVMVDHQRQRCGSYRSPLRFSSFHIQAMSYGAWPSASPRRCSEFSNRFSHSTTCARPFLVFTA